MYFKNTNYTNYLVGAVIVRVTSEHKISVSVTGSCQKITLGTFRLKK